MCAHCGCHDVPAIRELVDEHDALQEQAYAVRRALAAGDHRAAAGLLGPFVAHLEHHVAREEDGVFTALRDQGDFVEEVEALEGEHLSFAEALERLGSPDDEGFAGRVRTLLESLDVHIEREDVGIFPVSVVTLGATGWETVGRAHARRPSFLADGPTSA
ncbi:hemerythrin domain-containing protein [Nocardioides marmoribigeumensis]|uniref:Hemerythrin-like domain-containing protein n=1 Tax=Nocardioides marmoribigeumensis TaxID=433649 RepID=A0ABU2BYH6_9ACTN|nr:hemerythrin domain-containing protein [Nocardioides marmoribigeumensis]MDR7363445.1 hemerythrin-like domain-containing protein [Nocardioides marmoribigeumensis]